MLVRLVDAYGDDIRLVFRHYPLPTHPLASITAEATEAAGAQGAFWEMHDLLYERYSEWVALTAEELPALLAQYAEELDLNAEQFARDLEEHTYADRVAEQLADAVAMGLPGTPSFVINGKMYPFDWGLSELGINAFIQLVLLEDSLFDSPPPQVIDPDRQYTATIQTNRGDIVIELFASEAPLNVNSFVFLAQQGWYDGITFHRVAAGFVAQSGDPTGTGFANPGYQCDDEIAPGLSFDATGVVGIANAGTDTGSCQFFITLAPQPDLDGRYTVIGRVIEGSEVLESLTERDPFDPSAPTGDTVTTILIEER